MSKRDAILERLADFILTNGLDAATLRAMGEATDQSDRMLLYYFKDKDEITLAVLNVLASRITAALDLQKGQIPLRKDALHARMDRIILSDEIWPFFRLWLDLAARTARGDALVGPVGERLGLGFHSWIEDQLATPNLELRRKEATEIMIGLKGVLVMKSVGMQKLVEELL